MQGVVIEPDDIVVIYLDNEVILRKTMKKFWGNAIWVMEKLTAVGFTTLSSALEYFRNIIIFSISYFVILYKIILN